MADRRAARVESLFTLPEGQKRFIDQVRRDNGLGARGAAAVAEPPTLRDAHRLAFQAHSFAHEATRLQDLIARLREELAATGDELERERREHMAVRRQQAAMAAQFLAERDRRRVEAAADAESVARQQLITAQAELWAQVVVAFARQCMVAAYHTSDELSVRSQRFVNDLRALYDEIGHHQAAADVARDNPPLERQRPLTSPPRHKTDDRAGGSGAMLQGLMQQHLARFSADTDSHHGRAAAADSLLAPPRMPALSLQSSVVPESDDGARSWNPMPMPRGGGLSSALRGAMTDVVMNGDVAPVAVREPPLLASSVAPRHGGSRAQSSTFSSRSRSTNQVHLL